MDEQLRKNARFPATDEERESDAHLESIAGKLREMTPENRALFEKIAALREKIGPVDFDAVESLREMRS